MFYSSVPRQRPAGVLASSLTPRWQRALAGPRWSIGGQRCAGQLSAAQSRCAPPFACDRPAIDSLAHSLAPGPRSSGRLPICLPSKDPRTHADFSAFPAPPCLGPTVNQSYPSSSTRAPNATHSARSNSCSVSIREQSCYIFQNQLVPGTTLLYSPSTTPPTKA